MKRDDAWLHDLFAKHSRAVRAFAFRRVPPDVVDDVVAGVFAIAWRRGAPPKHPRPWLYRTAANVIGHHHRSRTRRLRHEQRGAEPAFVADGADAVTDSVRIAALLDRLPKADAEVIRLAYWEDLSSVDIGLVLGCTEGAARVRLHRARQRLAVLFQPETAVEPILILNRESR